MAKVIYLHLSVILFTRGVCLSACWDTTPLGADTPLEGSPPRWRHPLGQAPREYTPPRSRHPLGEDTPPQERSRPPQREAPPWEQTPQEQTPPRHMVNERPVRILLECILVFKCTCTRLCFPKGR